MVLKTLSRLSVLVLVLLALAIGLSAGVMLDRYSLSVAAQQPDPETGKPNTNLINEAWNTIERYYVDRSALKAQSLTYGAISGMVNALGDTGHSTFLTPQMVAQERNYNQGQFEGIGAEVEQRDDHVVILAPMDGSPAQKAGLKPGDIIQKVNGEDMTGLTVEQVVDKVLGPAGTSVTLTIVDPQTGVARDLTIVRARITLHNVTWQPIPGTDLADVRVAGFSQGVAQELKTTLTTVKQQGFKGIVLDLRNNPGGLLDEAVGVGSQFLSSGNLVLVKDAQGRTTATPVRPGGVAYDLPMVVLVNRGTASASEIVAGALQDARRANLVGETTFGTGTVLNVFGLSDGSALMLAVQEWLTPKGRVIWHHGIAPDLDVLMSPTTLVVTPETMKGMTAQQLDESGDEQLLTAIELLK